jgi:hypothetical protein
MCGAAALALLIVSGQGRAEGKVEKKDAPAAKEEASVGFLRIGTAAADQGDKESLHGWGRGGWRGGYRGGYRSYGYRHSYYRSYRYYYYSTPYYSYYSDPCYYYYSSPCCYYPTYYYYCCGATLGDKKGDEVRTSVERAETKLKLPASLISGK